MPATLTNEELELFAMNDYKTYSRCIEFAKRHSDAKWQQWVGCVVVSVSVYRNEVGPTEYDESFSFDAAAKFFKNEFDQIVRESEEHEASGEGA